LLPIFISQFTHVLGKTKFSAQPMLNWHIKAFVNRTDIRGCLDISVYCAL